MHFCYCLMHTVFKDAAVLCTLELCFHKWQHFVCTFEYCNDNDNNNRIERHNLRFFYYLLTAWRTVSNTYAQVAQAQSCANHVQHIGHLSCTTYHLPLGTKGQLSYWQNVNGIYFSFFFLLAEPLTDGGEETGVPRENPQQQASVPVVFLGRTKVMLLAGQAQCCEVAEQTSSVSSRPDKAEKPKPALTLAHNTTENHFPGHK